MPLWSTPDAPGELVIACRALSVPFVLLPKVLGALDSLLLEDNWQQSGTMTVEDAVEYMDEMVLGMRECMFVGTTTFGAWETIPENMLLCDGSTYNRVDYPQLYKAINSVYIIDADTFRVPDMINNFVRGVASTNDVDSTGGEDTVSLTASQNGPHGHGYNQPTFGVDIESVGVPDPTGVGNPPIVQQTTQSGNGEPHNNIPAYIGLVPVIICR